ncbi:MAG: hypothetical protein MNPFHGCM_01716 [Gemmatimonadaceae bacterium]|nr:hypothetical protein [Gemmatimonadaceae bacterium]
MLRRALTYAALAFAVYYAFQGGEYSSLDLVRQQSRARMLEASIDSLQRTVDSLTAFKKRLQGDLSLQERIAREQYGMVRGDKELLYRFVDPDSVSGGRRPPEAK